MRYYLTRIVQQVVIFSHFLKNNNQFQFKKTKFLSLSRNVTVSIAFYCKLAFFGGEKISKTKCTIIDFRAIGK